MTKEKWEEIKKTGELPISAIHDYWKENKAPEYPSLSEDEFEARWSEFIANFDRGLIQTPSGVRLIRTESVKQKIIFYFNNKFKE